MDPNQLADSLQQKINQLKEDETELQNSGLPSSLAYIKKTRATLAALLPGVLSGEPRSMQQAAEALGQTPESGATLLQSPNMKQRNLSPEETQDIEQILDRRGPLGW